MRVRGVWLFCGQHASFCSAVLLGFDFSSSPPHSLSGVQLPPGAEWPRSHSRRYEPGDKATVHHCRHEAEMRYAERVLLHQELTCPQHNKRGDRPNNDFSLQGVWQVSADNSAVSHLPICFPDEESCNKPFALL